MTRFNWTFFFNRRIFHASQGRGITLAVWVFPIRNSDSYQTEPQMRKISKVSTGMFICLHCIPFLGCVGSFKALFSLECLLFFVFFFKVFLQVSSFKNLLLKAQLYENNLLIIKQTIQKIYIYISPSSTALITLIFGTSVFSLSHSTAITQ